jgi:hypothetical protein
MVSTFLSMCEFLLNRECHVYHFWFVPKKNRDLWHIFYGQRVCKLLKCKYIYVLWMGTVLSLRDLYASR